MMNKTIRSVLLLVALTPALNVSAMETGGPHPRAAMLKEGLEHLSRLPNHKPELSVNKFTGKHALPIDSKSDAILSQIATHTDHLEDLPYLLAAMDQKVLATMISDVAGDAIASRWAIFSGRGMTETQQHFTDNGYEPCLISCTSSQMIPKEYVKESGDGVLNVPELHVLTGKFAKKTQSGIVPNSSYSIPIEAAPSLMGMPNDGTTHALDNWGFVLTSTHLQDIAHRLVKLKEFDKLIDTISEQFQKESLNAEQNDVDSFLITNDEEDDGFPIFQGPDDL